MANWQAIRFMEIVRRTTEGPKRTRWRWLDVAGGKTRLQLLDPQAGLYDFKLTPRGAMIRKVEDAR